MPDSQDSLVEAAVRPFSDNAEMKLAATRLLGELVKPDDAGAENVIARWDAVDGQRQGMARRFAFFGFVALVSAFVGVSDSGDLINHGRNFGYMISQLSSPPSGARQRILNHLTGPQKLLFTKEDTYAKASPTKEALWKSEPGNPAYFSEFVAVFSRETGSVSTDHLKTARQLDPDNAWFTYLAAEREAKDAATQNAAGDWKITDQARMDRVLALLREARDQPRYENYRAEMLSKRLSLLPQKNLPEHLDAVIVLASSELGSSTFLIHLQSAISARSWTAAETGDIEAFREISRDATHLLHGIHTNKVATLFDEVINVGMTMVISTRLGSDAEKLRLKEETGRWKGITTRISDNRKGRAPRKFLIEGRKANLLESGSVVMGGSLEVAPSATRFPPPLTDADLKPGRMLDHAILSRFCAYATWIVMALCLGATALYRFRVASMPRRLARRTVDLLDRRDWAWIVGGGVILPFAYVMAINHLTPLGGHESGLRGTAMLLSTMHFQGLWLLWFTVPAQIVRWRLARRADVMGFPKATWLGWVTVASAIAFVPLIGLAAISHSFGGFWKGVMADLEIEIIQTHISPALFWTAVGLMALPVAGTATRVCAAIFSRPGGLIPRTAASMALTRVYAGTLLLAALSIPAFKASGQYWFEQDRLMRADPSMPGWSAYEYKVAVQARKELREAMGYDP